MEPSIHTGSQHEALSKDNSGLRIYLHVWAPLKWSDMMFAQMCGFKTKEHTLQYPSGGPGPPLFGKETDCPMSQYGQNFASDSVSGKKSYEGESAAAEPSYVPSVEGVDLPIMPRDMF